MRKSTCIIGVLGVVTALGLLTMALSNYSSNNRHRTGPTLPQKKPFVVFDETLYIQQTKSISIWNPACQSSVCQRIRKSLVQERDTSA